MRPASTPDEEVLPLWYELGGLYAGEASRGNRATKLGFTVVCVVGALVLLSAPLLGTAWAGLFAPAIPVAAGLLSGGGFYVRERARFRGRVDVVRRMLAERGLDAGRPTREGLGAYYDAQLILLRSEYEYLRLRGAAESARLFEQSFGFTPEDPFETGPLNVAPDTEEVQLLRERWERRLQARRQSGTEPPELGLKEDRAYRVFPREMTVPAELATRRSYLTISRELLRERYGRDPRKKVGPMPEPLRRRVERDLREYAALTKRPARP
ncbi:MAG: hypothetical protein M3341_05100 [Actinomycetota bacterium]|nr:hypothetical protein [Actinomycetota bacterium]